MTLDYILNTYGYFALMIGTFLEGETMLVAAGFLAHRGYLELLWVIFFAFLGTLAGDQFYFFMGRAKGVDFIESKPGWKAKSTRVFEILKKHNLLYVSNNKSNSDNKLIMKTEIQKSLKQGQNPVP